uniref:HECW_N domain-containing protein n=1 Tax=Rhabditophanes sp. KR3021 TaxID=114890 RepID=A0AC35TR33_9BILA
MEKSCAASSFFGEISEVARDHLIYISSQQIFLTRRFDNFNVRLSYNFESPTNILDWVGLYQVDEKNALRYLVYAPIKCSQMSHNLNINLKYDTIFGPSSPVSISTFCFRYYGINGAVRATSPQFVIYSHAQIIVHKIFLTGLPSKVHNTFVKVKSGSYGYRTLTGEQNCTNWEDLVNFDKTVI